MSEDKNQYRPEEFEAAWRRVWEEEGLHLTDGPQWHGREKYYCLDMFPYPSGSGLHVGHWRGYVLSDVWSRYQVLRGHRILHPMGWDNFGLPAELDAIKKSVHPRISTQKNIDNMRRQLKEIGCMYDWTREITTSDPSYYRWTQEIFLRMFNKGLAYRKEVAVNWCNHCKVVLANEEVEGGKCERCSGGDIAKINKNQWMLKITAYAQRLLDDLDGLDWPEKVKEMQRNWIGRSEGARVIFTVTTADGRSAPVEVFTTRPDTLFGATYLVLAPEHPMVGVITVPGRRAAVEAYRAKLRGVSNVERQMTDRAKTGVFTGATAVNPVNGAAVPVWISDYVLMDYGTGAIMSVPAHDERDFAFAVTFGLPIIEVISSPAAKRDAAGNLAEAYVGDGILVNSGGINGLAVKDAQKKIVGELAAAGKGTFAVDYKLRDWIFARQRYWGEPIPVVHCKHCGIVAVPDDQLPVLLPALESYQPTGGVESPLAAVTDWVNTACPACGAPAQRETDTMPQWAGSSWYFLRYVSPRCETALVSPDAVRAWLPVDMYVGGIEHAVLHLLYARFWTKVLHDEGVVPFTEPFTRLFNQGMICRAAYKCDACNKWLAEDEVLRDPAGGRHTCGCGAHLVVSMEKMSKSKGNGVSPDELVGKFGTDAVRLYELFSGDPSQDSEWNDDGIKGCHSFLKKAWRFVCGCNPSKESSRPALEALNRLVDKVDRRLSSFKFNTAVSALMEFVNEAAELPAGSFSRDAVGFFVTILAPFAPHLAEELWRKRMGKKTSVFLAQWPVCDHTYLVSDSVEIVVQVNGKLRGTFTAAKGLAKEALEKTALVQPRVQEQTAGRTVRKIVVIPDKLVNIVVT